MADIYIKSEQQEVRPQFYGSKDSKFYFGMSNRIIIPLCAVAGVTFTQTRLFFMILLLVIIMEIVLVYFVKMTLSEVAFSLKRYLFSSARKRVKN